MGADNPVTMEELLDLAIPDHEKFPQPEKPAPGMCGAVNQQNGRYCERQTPHADAAHNTYFTHLEEMAVRKKRRNAIRLRQLCEQMVELGRHATDRGEALIKLTASKCTDLLVIRDFAQNGKHDDAEKVLQQLPPDDVKDLDAVMVGTVMLLIGQFAASLHVLSEASVKIIATLDALGQMSTLKIMGEALTKAEDEASKVFYTRVEHLRRTVARADGESDQEFEQRLHKTATEQITSEAVAEAEKDGSVVRLPGHNRKIPQA